MAEQTMMMTPTGKTVIVYHKNCWDGHCAAWLLRRVYPDAVFVPAQYGDEPPEAITRMKTVWIVDFSYPRDALRRVAANAAAVTVLDHHATAREALAGFEREWLLEAGAENVAIVFDMDRSGGRLTWDYLCEKHLLSGDRPWLVDYTEDRDLWRWALPNSREINAAIRSYPLDFAQWDAIAARDPHLTFTSEGGAILRRERQIIAEHVAHAREIDLAGHRVPCANATTLFSDIAGELAAGRPFGVCWFQREDRKFQYSLRSDEHGVDVSQIAKQFGGGGHVHAAGFTSDVLHD